MICEQCGKQEATVHVTSIVNGTKTEHHLCADCQSKENGQTMFSSFFDDTLFANQFFSNALYPLGQGGKQCPTCGMTWGDFNRTGRLGCDQCYTAFQGQVEPLIKRMQGTITYEGRYPKRGAGHLHVEQQIQTLRKDLMKAVKEEQFEEACRIRDEIKQLTEQLKAQ